MDFSIQKATELGVQKITPLITEHCVVRLEEDKWNLRIQHWRRIAQGASEQSGRNRLPLLETPIELVDWVSSRNQDGLQLMLDPLGQSFFSEFVAPRTTVTILIGPEGGFSDQERAFASDQGFKVVALGPRILRTETATLAAVSALQVIWGDMG